MGYFLNVLRVPMEAQGLRIDGTLDINKWNNSKLKDNMYLTAQPLYEPSFYEWEDLPTMFISDYRQLCPFYFEGGIKKSENWSNQDQNLIIFDIDDGLPITEAIEMFNGIKNFIYTTKSHQVEKKGVTCDRYRIIMPAINVPIGEQYFEVMRIIEKKYPFIDIQVNNKTGAFLGNFKSQLFMNNAGADFDFMPFIKMKDKLATLKQATLPVKTNFKAPTSNNNNNSEQIPVEDIKNRLTREIVSDIIISCGFEMNRQFMFKWRVDERTPSASVSPDLLIKDFGSDLNTDAIGFVMQAKQVDFKTACEYVSNFVGLKI